MGSLLDCFSEQSPKSKFIAYISLGDPTYELSVEWAKSIIEGGADILELGIPFTDPVADGPVIQASYKRALKNPFSVEKVLNTTDKIHQNHPNTPLVYLTYFNPVSHYGIEKFFERAYASGIRGLVIPDIPFDSKDSSTVFAAAEKYKVDIIQLVTPATTTARMKQAKKFASGFIYYVTSFGVTGTRNSLPENLRERIELVKSTMQIPVCAGFGISRPEQAREISQYADGIIIGSAIQKIIEEFSNVPDECNKRLNHYIREIRNSIP